MPGGPGEHTALGLTSAATGERYCEYVIRIMAVKDTQNINHETTVMKSLLFTVLLKQGMCSSSSNMIHTLVYSGWLPWQIICMASCLPGHNIILMGWVQNSLVML